MRFLLALSLVAAACGGPQKKSAEETTKQEEAQESCCCKWTPMTSEDGAASYEVSNPIECSGKQGECVDQVQCQSAPKPE